MGSIKIEPDSKEGERQSGKLWSTTVSVVTLKRAVKSQLPIAEGHCKTGFGQQTLENDYLLY